MLFIFEVSMEYWLYHWFVDCNVFIYDFHHEQAWERWLSAIKNGARIIKSEMLCKFRRIARSRTEKELKDAIDDLRNCEQWKSGYASMVNWFEKQWMPLIKVSKILVYFMHQFHRIFGETVQFRGKFFFFWEKNSHNYHKIIDKKGGRPSALETPRCFFSFLRFSEKVILMSAIRFGYPLQFSLQKMLWHTFI